MPAKEYGTESVADTANDTAIKHDTVIRRFRRNLENRADRDLYVFVDGKGRDQERLTYRQFATAIDGLASHLTETLGFSPGDRLLLVYPPSSDFVVAFVGCMAAGIIPVPLAPPNPFQLTQDLRAFEAVAENSGSVGVLTNGSYLRAKRLAAAKELFARREGAWSTLPWHRTDRLSSGTKKTPSFIADPEATAFLQYTSGSTASPKGVMISHTNILHQVEINSKDLGITPDSRAVFWVPHFHDFCLVSGILSALSGNAVLYLMSPITFLRRPHLWFDVLSRVRATHTAAPDFAYRLATRKTNSEQRQQWDLSALEVAMSAAEPIRRTTVDGFLEAFAESKLSPRAFCPAYGLAEHTVGVSVAGSQRLEVDREALEQRHQLVVIDHSTTLDAMAAAKNSTPAKTALAKTTPARSTPASATLTLFGCGSPSVGVDVRIVDPEEHRELEPDQIGEIWVDSPSKALGYYGLAELSDAMFRARLSAANDNDSSDDREALANSGYLRTGDLGFVHEGEIFVTGRRKDLIIIRGRNLYPQDIEESVFSSHPLIRPGRAAAFSIPATRGSGGTQDREQIVVLTEVLNKKMGSVQLDEVVHAARSSIQREHGIPCDVLLIAPPGAILKTTSGKIRRQACRIAYQQGDLEKRMLRIDVKRPKPAAGPFPTQPNDGS